MREAQGLVQNVWGDMVRVGHIADIHPTTNRLILMVVPVNHRPHGANDKQHRDRQRQKKCQRQYRLFPAKLFHLMLVVLRVGPDAKK